MDNWQKIFIFTLLSAFFIYAYLNIPIGDYGNANTDPEFVTIGDTVVVELPLIEENGVWQKLDRVEAVPVVVDSDSIFWDDKILDFQYGIIAGKKAKIGLNRGSSKDMGFAIRNREPGGQRLIRLIVPDDSRLSGQSLVWKLWLADNPIPSEISFNVSEVEQKDTYTLYKFLRILFLVLSILAVLMLLGVTIGRRDIVKSVISRRLRAGMRDTADRDKMNY